VDILYIPAGTTVSRDNGTGLIYTVFSNLQTGRRHETHLDIWQQSSVSPDIEFYFELYNVKSVFSVGFTGDLKLDSYLFKGFKKPLIESGKSSDSH
jgi:hypothetical protein